MRRLLTFPCEGATLGATLDAAVGEVGLVMVTGGSQTRIGSHRMYERLSKALSREGFSCLRYDRRGTGDSEGEDPGFRGSGPDIEAAAALLRSECPTVRRLFGFGLCDGATALALLGAGAGLDGLILVNPWLVETASGEPAPAAIRSHYRHRLLSREGWRKLLSGSVSYKKLLRGIVKTIGGGEAGLAEEVARALHRHGLPAQLILASRDATAVAAEHELKSRAFKDFQPTIQRIDSDSHTFARPGDEERLLAATLAALRRLDF